MHTEGPSQGDRKSPLGPPRFPGCLESPHTHPVPAQSSLWCPTAADGPELAPTPWAPDHAAGHRGKPQPRQVSLGGEGGQMMTSRSLGSGICLFQGGTRKAGIPKSAHREKADL